MKIIEIRQKKLITAIKTPYTQTGEIDIENYDRLVERQIAGGVEGLIVGGTTGEGHLMSWDEHIMLIAHSVNKFGSRIMVVGNTGSNNTKESISATAQGFDVGMHAALLINPYYGKTSNEGLLAHFKASLPIGPAIIYNVPRRTAQDIPVEIVQKLTDFSENLVGVKECMGVDRIYQYYTKGIFCWVGNDEQAFEAYHKHKALGVISVASNVIPELMHHLLDKKDESFDQNLQPFFRWLGIEPNPIPLNSILADLGLIKPILRLPYCALPKNQRQEGLDILKTLLPQMVKSKALEDKEFINL